jgi:hypothetical protein
MVYCYNTLTLETLAFKPCAWSIVPVPQIMDVPYHVY